MNPGPFADLDEGAMATVIAGITTSLDGFVAAAGGTVHETADKTNGIREH